MPWDVQADVVVVGFGAAGACAALEAASRRRRRGRARPVLRRRRHRPVRRGGLRGGGTPAARGRRHRHAEAMFGYLSPEVGDAVSAATLREFCEGSRAMLAWLEGTGCRSRGACARTRPPTRPTGTTCTTPAASCPPPASPARAARPPCPWPRHLRQGAVRPAGPGRPGPAPGAVQTIARTLTTDADGRVTGVECRTLRGAPAWARFAHRVLHRWSAKPDFTRPKLGRLLHRPVAWLERRHSRPLRIRARHGVVLAAGGFVATGR